MEDGGREQRVVFGEVAELYERARPSYPAALVDEVISAASLSPGDRVLEVGAGTGKATRLFAARGMRMVCVEPSPTMVAVARRRCAGFPDVTFEPTGFEDWPVDPGAFRLVVSAQAWHWVSPEVRCRKAHGALAPGGVVALFWNGPRITDPGLRQALDEVYARVAPGLPAASPTRDGGELEELRRSGLFVEVGERSYAWCEEYSATRYVELMATQSDHRMLNDDDRRRLLDAVGGVVAAAGGAVTVDYVTKLYLARRS